MKLSDNFVKLLVVELLEELGIKFDDAPKILRDMANDFEKISKEE